MDGSGAELVGPGSVTVVVVSGAAVVGMAVVVSEVLVSGTYVGVLEGAVEAAELLGVELVGSDDVDELRAVLDVLSEVEEVSTGLSTTGSCRYAKNNPRNSNASTRVEVRARPTRVGTGRRHTGTRRVGGTAVTAGC